MAPTEIVLDLSTNVPCSSVTGVRIDVGQTGDAGLAADLETQQCSAGEIGTLVVTPGGASDPTVTIEIAAAVGTTTACDPPYSLDAGPGVGCIVARRALRYSPHLPLRLPIALNSDCLNVPCPADQTCLHGQCTSSLIDPSTCEGDAGCQLVDGGGPRVPVQLAVGAAHACALMSDGTVECWGDDTYGQLGSPSVTGSSPIPVQVAVINDARSISAANATTCVVRATNDVWCWGDDANGVVDAVARDAGSNVVATPTGPVLANVKTVAVGISFACALLASGTQTTECWGERPSSTASFGPGLAVIGGVPPNASLLACGISACIETDGVAVGLFGEDMFDQLLLQNMGEITAETLGSFPLDPVTSVAMGSNFGCAAGGGSGSVVCWGVNDAGQLGQSTMSGPQLIASVPSLSNVTALSAAGSHVFVLVAGVPYGWGDNSNGLLGLGTFNSPQYGPTALPLTNVDEIVTGTNGTCARQGATVTCWGIATMLGDGSPTSAAPRAEPRAPVSL